jgi:hypothetical protein
MTDFDIQSYHLPADCKSHQPAADQMFEDSKENQDKEWKKADLMTIGI